MDRLRNWRKLFFEDPKLNLVFYGALDDCLVNKQGKLIPIDFKTRGFELKEKTSNVYQNQLDCYALLLEKNGFKHSGFAYLIYYIPKQAKPNGIIEFKVEVKKMKTDSTRAMKIIKQALAVLKGKKPKSHSACTYCSWVNDWAEMS